ncbi:uncharacterized protein [Centruroides vittatus]|uniref:uncharacterized protein n=1 Tax=Centruroides vittatus TaxID=120091 RepID=UPI0035100AF7
MNMNTFGLFTFFSIISLFECSFFTLNPNSCALSYNEMKDFTECLRNELSAKPAYAFTQLLDCIEENHREESEIFLIKFYLCEKSELITREITHCLRRDGNLEKVRNTLSDYQLELYDFSTACYRAITGKK